MRLHGLLGQDGGGGGVIGPGKEPGWGGNRLSNTTEIYVLSSLS